MVNTGIKRTLNLHKYSVRVNDIVLNWNIIIPVCFAITGLVIGCASGRGERALYLKIISLFRETVIGKTSVELIPDFIKSLLFPTVFTGLLFFAGLSAYGGIVSQLIPAGFTYFVGAVSYYMYTEYTLKGLAYCMIMIFPYAVLSAASIVLCSSECIKMSEIMLKSISKSNKMPDYSFTDYYRHFLKNYSLVIIASVVYIAVGNLFIGIFIF